MMKGIFLPNDLPKETLITIMMPYKSSNAKVKLTVVDTEIRRDKQRQTQKRCSPVGSNIWEHQ